MFQYSDFFGNVSADPSLVADEISADANGTGVDCRGVDGVAVIFNVGAGGSLGASNYYELKVQHSDDNSTFSDVSAGDLVGEDGPLSGAVVVRVNANTAASKVYGASYVNSKRYVRAVADESGTATLNVSATILRYRKQYP